ncbi:hypothetical protein UA75_19620 [Actinoalloteichus sp. GBA129-24]|uniref:Uncharacterized protein n=1 Tax=Actinoalloteichus fjordicus TaxID=1612552 RepID=A0AAC9LEE1_9PSEU|nr:hypothetical protein UA74_19130 [Actinoalloteichus fjordicus]APU21913.1 hypothetical protein UA75_19620 [Actinoalloteichus sp. GBA129-24]
MQVLIPRVSADRYAKFGDRHPGELISTLFIEQLAQFRSGEALIDDVSTVRPITPQWSQQLCRISIVCEHVKTPVVNGGGHDTFKAAQQTKNTGTDFTIRCLRERRQLTCEAEEVIPFSVREVEGPCQGGEDFA